MRIVEIIQPLVLPVDCERVLSQIVGSDAEEIHQLCELLAHHDRCRCLHHDSLLRNRIRDSLVLQLPCHLIHNFPDLLHFLYGNDHGIHDGEIAIFRSAKKRSQLRPENVRLLQADPDCAISHCRIGFLSKLKIICVLVRSDIKSADDHLLTRHGLKHLPVGIELLRLIRKRISADVQELTAEQSDALRIVLNRICHIGHTADVRIDMNLLPALCHRLTALVARKKLSLLQLLLLHFFCSIQLTLIRIHIECSISAVYNGSRSVSECLQIKLHTDQCRNVHHSGKNRRVRIR